ncbi:MAG: hypothetical protein HYS07_05845 [Chlamydiae bacterium]|nr:hypothetical protein [Chlamydiota bacterium]MBI3277270.1 hypothetical protein [Chlamydiota bacterium]
MRKKTLTLYTTMLFMNESIGGFSMNPRVKFLARLLFVVFCSCSCLGRADQTIEDFYEHAKPPAVRLVVKDVPGANPVTQLELPAVLAILKYELTTGQWPNLSNTKRRELISILDDANAQCVITRKQSTWACSAGGQTIDKNKVLLNQDGLYFNGSPRSHFDIAKLLLHELGHLHQERYNILWRPGKIKEWFPQDLEKQLSPTNFSPEKVKEVTKLLAQGRGEIVDRGPVWEAERPGTILLSRWAGLWDGGDTYTVHVKVAGDTVEATVRHGPDLGREDPQRIFNCKVSAGGRQLDCQWESDPEYRDGQKHGKRSGTGTYTLVPGDTPDGDTVKVEAHEETTAFVKYGSEMHPGKIWSGTWTRKRE